MLLYAPSVVIIGPSSNDWMCDICHQRIPFQICLISHKILDHKLTNQTKLSKLLQNVRNEEILYSSDSENEYHIVSKVIRVPKQCQRKTKCEEEENVSKTSDQVHAKFNEGSCSDPDSVKTKEEDDIQPCLSVQSNSEELNYNAQISTKSYICDYCSGKYTTKCGLKKHMFQIHLKLEQGVVKQPRKCQTATSAYQHECSKCSKRMYNETYKQKHEQNCFNHLCNYCGKYFKNATNLSVHIMSHEKVRPFACSLCDKAFLIKRSLLDHMNKHAGVKPYRCPYENCNKTFALSTGVRQHINCMHLEKKFVCHYCQHQCSTKFHLDCHIRTHNGEKPFKCNVCSAYFRLPSTFKKHQRVHSGERPYRCDVCLKVSETICL